MSNFKDKMTDKLSGISDTIYNVGWNVEHAPSLIKLEMKNKKYENKRKIEKKEIFKIAENEFPNCYSMQVYSGIIKRTDNDFGRVVLLNKFETTTKWLQYSLLYMTDENIPLVKASDSEQKLVNGIVKYFGYEKIYKYAGAYDIECFDMSYRNKYSDSAEYILSIKSSLLSIMNDELIYKKIERNKKMVKAAKQVVDFEEVNMKLLKIFEWTPFNSRNFIAYRVIEIEKRKYRSGYNGAESYDEYMMPVIELIEGENKDRFYLFNDKSKYEVFEKFYKENYYKLENKKIFIDNFSYSPIDIYELDTLLCKIIPRFDADTYILDTKFFDNSCVDRKYKIECEKWKKDFIYDEDLMKLNEKLIQRFIYIYNKWMTNNYEQFFEMIPTEYWKGKFVGLKNIVEQFKQKELEEERSKVEEEWKEAGKKGEADVEYALKWLESDEYIVVKKNENGIQLKDSKLSDESQEIDHIVIGKQGVFVIETKNYAGTITIDEHGQWIRKKVNGEVIGEKNPVQQTDRHHLLVESILSINDIFDIICIANDNAIIEGVDNSSIPIVKVDMLARFIKNFKNNSGVNYSADEIKEFERKLEMFRVDI